MHCYIATFPLQVKSARWIADGQIWLSIADVQFDFQVLKHILQFSAGLFYPSFSLTHLPWGEDIDAL